MCVCDSFCVCVGGGGGGDSSLCFRLCLSNMLSTCKTFSLQVDVITPLFPFSAASLSYRNLQNVAFCLWNFSFVNIYQEMCLRQSKEMTNQISCRSKQSPQMERVSEEVNQALTACRRETLNQALTTCRRETLNQALTACRRETLNQALTACRRETLNQALTACRRETLTEEARH